MGDLGLTIGAVERETGLSKDVLRVWERRYGFPTPERTGSGERLYPADQVQRLRLIKRLMDLGHRPGRLINRSTFELDLLTTAPSSSSLPVATEDLDRLVSLIREHDVEAVTETLQHRLVRDGLYRFVQDTVAPLSVSVGMAWQNGRLEVFEEHVFTELVERVLRQAIAAVPAGTEPRVLLTSVPGEQHELGLLMAEAILALEGARCIPLGSQMPLQEIANAARAHRADVVALSFSSAFARRQIPGVLNDLRSLLPTWTQLWAGGSGSSMISAPSGVQTMVSLEDAAAAVSAWRSLPTRKQATE